MKIRATVVMTYPTSNQDERQGLAALSICDRASGVEFVRVTLTPQALRNMLASHHGGEEEDCDAEVHGLDWVGRKRMQETFTYTHLPAGWRSGFREFLKAKVVELNVEGWLCDTPRQDCSGRWIVTRRKYV